MIVVHAERIEIDSEIEHVERPALPWRSERMTECGLTEAPERHIITRDVFLAKVRRLGKKRSAMSTCMTCWDASQRWKDWVHAPSEVLRREVIGTRHDRTGGVLLDGELRAIEALIARHREEFDAYVKGLEDTRDLATAREIRRRRIVGERKWIT